MNKPVYKRLDTLKFSKTLIEAGMPRELAEAQTVAMSDAFDDVLHQGVATKADIKASEAATRADTKTLGVELRGEIKKLEADTKILGAELRAEIKELETTTKKEIQRLESFVKKEIQRLDGSIQTLGLKLTIRLGSMMVALGMVLAAVIKL